MENPYEDNSEYSRDLEVEMNLEQQKITREEIKQREIRKSNYYKNEVDLDEPRLRTLLIG
jgi:hypothetical protein